MLIFSKHALARIAQRKIALDNLNKTIENPDKLIKEDEEQYKAVKLFRDKVIVIIYTENNGVKFIITLWESSKIKKYL